MNDANSNEARRLQGALIDLKCQLETLAFGADEVSRSTFEQVFSTDASPEREFKYGMYEEQWKDIDATLEGAKTGGGWVAAICRVVENLPQIVSLYGEAERSRRQIPDEWLSESQRSLDDGWKAQLTRVMDSCLQFVEMSNTFNNGGEEARGVLVNIVRDQNLERDLGKKLRDAAEALQPWIERVAKLAYEAESRIDIGKRESVGLKGGQRRSRKEDRKMLLALFLKQHHEKDPQVQPLTGAEIAEKMKWEKSKVSRAMNDLFQVRIRDGKKGQKAYEAAYIKDGSKGIIDRMDGGDRRPDGIYYDEPIDL